MIDDADFFDGEAWCFVDQRFVPRANQCGVVSPNNVCMKSNGLGWNTFYSSSLLNTTISVQFFCQIKPMETPGGLWSLFAEWSFFLFSNLTTLIRPRARRKNVAIFPLPFLQIPIYRSITLSSCLRVRFGKQFTRMAPSVEIYLVAVYSALRK